MKFTPHDIENREFQKVFRGYDLTEVRNFLREVAEEWEKMERQCSELSEKVIGLDTKLKDFNTMEKALQQTFVQAQETSGKAIEHARKEAQLIIQEAEVKASQIVEKARTDLTMLKEQLTILKAKKDAIVSRLKMILNSELDLVKALEVDEEFQAQEKQNAQPETSRDRQEIDDILKSLDR